MRSITKLFGIAFLLMLYIGPSLFALSYASSATPTEPNMNKDFSIAVEYSEIFLATAGEGLPSPTGSYTDTHIKDESSMFNIDASSPYDSYIILEFTLDAVNIIYVYLNFYGYTFTGDLSATTKELLVWNGTHWNDFGDIAENNFGWTNITLDSTYVVGQTVYMKAHVVDNTMITLLIDYVEVQFIYTPLAWDEIDEVEFVFNVPLDETGLNMLLIFLGLIMIPTSTIYAAKGGLKEASSNKLFYFLIIFVLGWGLFLGGIFG